jgi:ribonucleotide reductase beta subunit family protein with ferritin-like domain
MKFYEALKRAVEQGAEFRSTVEHSIRFRWTNHELEVYTPYIGEWRISEEHVGDMMFNDYELVANPLKSVLETRLFNDPSLVGLKSFNYIFEVSESLERFVGNKVKVTVEEII